MAILRKRENFSRIPTKISLILALLFANNLLECVVAILPEEFECPTLCDCHYFRINWVTDCSQVGLSTVPEYNDGLSPNVYVLNLNNNNLTNINTFPESIKLRRLLIANNYLRTITRLEFSGLKYLIDLDLSGNEISYIEPDAFIESPGLITLELQHNNLERIEGSFLISKSLLNLDLSDCNLDYLNRYFFTDLPALDSINLSGNPIGQLDDGIFDKIISLQELKLNHCQLKTISSKAFGNLEDLKSIELTNNSLLGPVDWLEIFKPLVRLEYLDLRLAGLEKLPVNLFKNNLWLRKLVLAENNLDNTDLATVLGENFTQLDILDVSMCNIQLHYKTFTNARNLRTLILSDNDIPSTDLSVSLAALVNLQKLSLRNCSLNRFPTNTFNQLKELKELDISFNPLSLAFTSLLSPLEKLTYLDMSYCNLTYISKNTFIKMSNLKKLILSGNPLKKLEYGLFQNLINLNTLELKNCGLTEISDTVFEEKISLGNLAELNLAENPLKVLKHSSFLPKQLNKLKSLDISLCNITELPANEFDSFTTIKQLNLSGNKLSDTNLSSFDFLKYLPALEKLDLSKNRLTQTTPELFKYSANLVWLKLEGNPWECGCYIVHMWEWAQHIKGDLTILAGSTSSQVSPKNTKTLLCHKNINKNPITVNKLKQSKTNVNKDQNTVQSWAKYVRETKCFIGNKSLNPARRDGDSSVLPAFLIRDNANGKPLINSDSDERILPGWALSTALVLSLMLIAMASLIFKSTGRNLDKA